MAKLSIYSCESRWRKKSVITKIIIFYCLHKSSAAYCRDLKLIILWCYTISCIMVNFTANRKSLRHFKFFHCILHLLWILETPDILTLPWMVKFIWEILYGSYIFWIYIFISHEAYIFVNAILYRFVYILISLCNTKEWSEA